MCRGAFPESYTCTDCIALGQFDTYHANNGRFGLERDTTQRLGLERDKSPTEYNNLDLMELHQPTVRVPIPTGDKTPIHTTTSLTTKPPQQTSLGVLQSVHLARNNWLRNRHDHTTTRRRTPDTTAIRQLPTLTAHRPPKYLDNNTSEPLSSQDVSREHR